MKRKIICTAVVLVLCAVFCVNVCAAEPYHSVPKSEWDPVHIAADKYLNDNYDSDGYWYSRYNIEFEGYNFCYCASGSYTTLQKFFIGEYFIITDTPAPDNVCPIYAVKDDVAYNLQDVYDQNLLDFEKVMKYLGGGLSGDANQDWNLDITDVTQIQRYLTDHNEVSYNDYYDYDRDNHISIKDATAIQKHLAEIE